MVSSTAMPSAMQAIRLIAGLSGIPAQPRVPKKIAIGSRFGNSAIRPVRNEVNMIASTA
jgi:hypothetical protein